MERVSMRTAMVRGMWAVAVVWGCARQSLWLAIAMAHERYRPYILLGNLAPSAGMCNDTRLIVRRMSDRRPKFWVGNTISRMHLSRGSQIWVLSFSDCQREKKRGHQRAIRDKLSGVRARYVRLTSCMSVALV
jgi:hypothetical protein